MLANASMVIAMIPVKDYARARQFYTEVLGLTEQKVAENAPPSFVTANGSQLVLFVPNESTTPTHTLASFAVDNIEQVVNSLQAQGVQFEHVEMPDGGPATAENGIMEMDGSKIAWFKDSEDNILGIGQM